MEPSDPDRFRDWLQTYEAAFFILNGDGWNGVSPLKIKVVETETWKHAIFLLLLYWVVEKVSWNGKLDCLRVTVISARNAGGMSCWEAKIKGENSELLLRSMNSAQICFLRIWHGLRLVARWPVQGNARTWCEQTWFGCWINGLSFFFDFMFSSSRIRIVAIRCKNKDWHSAIRHVDKTGMC